MSQGSRDARQGPAGGPGRDLSPLTPFSAVDELCCYYDSAAEPNTVHLEVQLPGHLDYAALRLASARALDELPRARASRAPGSLLRRSYSWQYPRQPDIDPVSRATWAGEQELALLRQAFLAASLPLDSSPPLRLLLAVGPVSDCLILGAHHAALDGLSCLQLLRRIGQLYRRADQEARDPAATLSAAANAHPITTPVPPPGSPAPGSPAPGSPAPAADGLARTPENPARTPENPARAPDGSGRGTPAGRRPILPRLPARIAAERGHGRDGHGRDGYGVCLISFAGVPAVPSFAPDRRVTLNDLLIAALILAIGRWNAARGRPARQVRISMPLNARLPGQETALGNLSRIGTVAADPPLRDGDPGALAELVLQVARQTSDAKASAGPQVGFGSRGLAAAWLPATAKRRVVRAVLRTAGPALCDTSMLTNLGNITAPPQFGLTGPARLAFSSSAHMPRGLSVGAVATDGQLQLALRYRYALLDDASAAKFAAGYAAALNELAGHPAAGDAGLSRGAAPGGRKGSG